MLQLNLLTTLVTLNLVSWNGLYCIARWTQIMLNIKVLNCLLPERIICHNKWILSGLEHVTKNSGIVLSPSFIPLFKVTEVDGATTCMYIGY